MYYLLLFHGNNDYANTPQCYVYMYIAFLVDMLTNIPICAEGSTSVLVKRTEHKKLKITVILSAVADGRE